MRLSPIGLTRRGPRVAKMPIVRRWLRSRNGICRSGASPAERAEREWSAAGVFSQAVIPAEERRFG
jgi:hypothetical protein